MSIIRQRAEDRKATASSALRDGCIWTLDGKGTLATSLADGVSGTMPWLKLWLPRQVVSAVAMIVCAIGVKAPKTALRLFQDIDASFGKKLDLKHYGGLDLGRHRFLSRLIKAAEGPAPCRALVHFEKALSHLKQRFPAAKWHKADIERFSVPALHFIACAGYILAEHAAVRQNGTSESSKSLSSLPCRQIRPQGQTSRRYWARTPRERHPSMNDA